MELNSDGKNVLGKWVYGDLVRTKKLTFICVPKSNTGTTNYNIEDIETIGQYTGLYDINGKKIYEGDIVSKETFDDTKPNYRAVSYAKVMWVEELAGFYLLNKNNKILWELSEEKYSVKVAGNIYDDKNFFMKRGII